MSEWENQGSILSTYFVKLSCVEQDGVKLYPAPRAKKFACNE